MEADEPIIVETGPTPRSDNPLRGTITLAWLREEVRRRFPPGSDRRHLPDVEEGTMLLVSAALWKRLEALTVAGNGRLPPPGLLAVRLLAWALESVGTEPVRDVEKKLGELGA
jgi:hypothetical protein